jgi:hypothetical protein
VVIGNQVVQAAFEVPCQLSHVELQHPPSKDFKVAPSSMHSPDVFTHQKTEAALC